MATETTLTAAKAWHPDSIGFPAIDVVPDALIMQASTVSGTVEGDEPAVRVPYVDDADAQFSAEGATIPEADPDLAEALVHTGKITQLVKISREQFDQGTAASLLSTSVRRAVIKKANLAFLTQVAPTPPAVQPPAGLTVITGTEAGGAVAADLDVLTDLLATLEATDAIPTMIVVDPVGWASLSKFKTATDSSQTLLGAGVEAGERRLLGLPVFVTSAMPASTGFVIDRSQVVSAVGPVNVATSRDVYFASDSIGLRVTWRIGWNAVHPERLGEFTVTAPV